VAFICAACSFDFYQNPVPSAAVAVAHPAQPGSVLVLKRRIAPGVGLWCIPGGFIRYGESPEAAAVRELREEVGIEARIGRPLRVGLIDYRYRGRRLCVLEVAFLATLKDIVPLEGFATAEAQEVAFWPVRHLLEKPETLAFPEQAGVLEAFELLLRNDRA
jgi:8-oxo-dGTP diphosphatase